MSEAWRTDQDAAEAEARRRIAAAVETGAEVLDLSDLRALRVLPAEVVEARTVRSLFIGRKSAARVFHSDGAPQIEDVSALASMTWLHRLDMRFTPITDAAPLAGLTALTLLSLADTRIETLDVLFDLPYFADERAKALWFDGTPAAAADRRLDLLSRLPPARCALETVQYLKGTHPDFRDPPGGARRAGLPDRLAAAAPVGLELREGRPEAVNPAPPERLAPVELSLRVRNLRGEARALLDAGRQLPDFHRAALGRYVAALAEEPPTHLLLDGPTAILRGASTDPYVTDALDRGFVGGWRALVQAHDDLRPLLVPPEEVDLPEPVPEATQEAGLDLAAAAREVLAPAAEDGDVGRSVVGALDALTDYLLAAQGSLEHRPGLLRRGLVGLGGVLALLLQHGAAAASLQRWAATPQGQAVLAKLAPVFEALLRLVR